MPHRKARDQTSQSNRNASSRKPLQKASVIEKACKQETQGTPAVDKKVLNRIQKCLDRAHHANTSESEAKTALFVSHKLMSLHNVSQADIMDSDDNNDKGHFAGQSIVRIQSIVDRFKRVVNETFVGKLVRAMEVFFDCKTFSTDHRKYINWTFYGIASNTVAAAMAFEITHNKILEWACAYKGGPPTFCYCLGVADGLMTMANREKKRDLDEERRKELDIMAAKDRESTRERHQQLDRLRLLLASSSADTKNPEEIDNADLDVLTDMSDLSSVLSDDDGEFGIEADFDVDDAEAMDLDDDQDRYIERLANKREQTKPQSSIDVPNFNTKPDSGIKQEPELKSIQEESHWKSGMQLVRFWQTAEQVANDYLKQNNIKLRSGKKKRPSTIRDRDSYRRGQKDSAKIKVQD